jgi:hypothetical protein
MSCLLSKIAWLPPDDKGWFRPEGRGFVPAGKPGIDKDLSHFVGHVSEQTKALRRFMDRPFIG